MNKGNSIANAAGVGSSYNKQGRYSNSLNDLVKSKYDFKE